MNPLITEFTARNDVSLEMAYATACHYVAETRDVQIADVRQVVADQRGSVELAIYAAAHSELEVEPCASALQTLTARQLQDLALSLGVASMGDPDGTVARNVEISLGHPPLGASRWVEAVADADALGARIVQWLLVIVDRRTAFLSGTQSMAQETENEISSNLPAPGVGTDPAEEEKFWRIW